VTDRPRTFPQYEGDFGFPVQEEAVLAFWDEQDILGQVNRLRAGAPHFVFYEGPPTANGRPGIHHVIARTIKDLVCRHRTMKGLRVDRKGGWDTHGLPVELEVEKRLGLPTKADVEAYGVAEFNLKCKESVFAYLQDWNKLTRRMGFWLDLERPYITFTNEYIESVWWILAQLYRKDLLYNGNRVVAYCPRCETAQSSHEVAQGYKDTDDPSVFVTMPLVEAPDTSFLVWTTTPWTLISNVVLALSAEATYVLVRHGDRKLILAEALAEQVLGAEFVVLERHTGAELAGKKYVPLFEFFPEVLEQGCTTVTADFVTLSEGTGIVHIAPAYGEDDHDIGKRLGLPMPQPLNRAGRFTSQAGPYEGQFFKDADPQITRDLKTKGRLLRSGRYTHTYPFCWRCDSPLIYMARPSWYIRTTRVKERLLEHNRSIHWHPPEIGSGRFGEWLEGNVDWALSRDRFWGTPLNLWICDECGDTEAVESVAELGRKTGGLPEPLDLHKPWVDELQWACDKCGGRKRRTPEVIDVWFDSGAMPIAQWHYPFENKEAFEAHFPADFISEAVDQTRGWFYSLLAISTLLFDKPAYKNCVVMELILDREGQKMSKSKGNVVDPWQVIGEVGIDPLRWYMLAASQPWIPLKFDLDGPRETARKLFSTLNNTYSFFALYANVDSVPGLWLNQPPPALSVSDRWLLSRVHTLSAQVDRNFEEFDLTRALRAISSFVQDELSNWYVRRSRRRFWVQASGDDKRAAFYTLYQALVAVSKLMAPAAPFTAERLYRDLVSRVDPASPASVHMVNFPASDAAQIDLPLEASMALAMEAVSLGRAARAGAGLKVRQPVARLVVVLPQDAPSEALRALSDLVADEVNAKAVTFTSDASGIQNLKVKPLFPKLGPPFGKRVNEVASLLKQLGPEEAARFKAAGEWRVHVDGHDREVTADMVEFLAEPQPGWALASEGGLTVAVDTSLSEDLLLEGLARELVNRIQSMRKEAGFDVTDRIVLGFEGPEAVRKAFEKAKDYILQETLTVHVTRPGQAGEFQKSWPLAGGEAHLSVSRAGAAQQGT